MLLSGANPMVFFKSEENALLVKTLLVIEGVTEANRLILPILAIKRVRNGMWLSL